MPDPSGEYDEARGGRPQDVGVSSLRPHSQRSAKTPDDDRRRAVQPEPAKAHSAATAFTKQDDEPRRLTATGCDSRPGQQRGPWADGQTTHDKTIPVDQLSGGSKRRGESVWPPEKQLRGRQRGARRVIDFSTNYNAPNPHQ